MRLRPCKTKNMILVVAAVLAVVVLALSPFALLNSPSTLRRIVRTVASLDFTGWSSSVAN